MYSPIGAQGFDNFVLAKVKPKMFYVMEAVGVSFYPFYANVYYFSHHNTKPTICICENKSADQLCSNCTADQRLCFRSIDSTIPHLLKSNISSFQLASMAVQPGVCQTWSESKIVGFLLRWLIYSYSLCCFFCLYTSSH